MKRRLKKLLRLLMIAVPVIVLAGVVTLEISIRRATLPAALNEERLSTPTYLDRSGNLLAQLATEDARLQIQLSLDEMGDHLPAATIALEDHRFQKHSGVDFYAIVAAAARNMRRSGGISGASTISQQVIKQADRRKGRALKAKLREAVLALKLERSWEKEAILATYLNSLDYGNRRLGPESAAMAYFGKKAKALTQPEAIFLAGLPQSPSRHNPWKHPARAIKKYQRSLTRLKALEILDQAQYETFKSNPPIILREAPVNLAQFFLQAALTGDQPSPGVHLMTLDLSLQKSAEAMLAAQLDAINRHEVRNAAIVVIENATGAVRALASSGEGSKISGATIPRHAGSTLKPFVYLMGIDEKKFTAATVFTDTQDAVAKRYADYDPHNFNRGYRGPVRLREALANSMNIPAVLALEQIGARRCFFELEEWGLHKEEKFEELGAGFVLGNLRVSLLDLTAAYAGLARGGLAAPVQFFADQAPSPQRRIVAPEATAIIEDILCDNDARSQAFGSDSPLNLGWRAAVKTGTSSSFRDAWTVGFCRDYTVGVWVGNYQGQSMSGTLAVQTATPIWRRMMNYLKNQHGARPLEAPRSNAQLVTVKIDPLSGLLPSGESQKEWFLAGTAPATGSEDWYTTGTKNPRLPEAYAKWVNGHHNHLGATLQPSFELKILSPSDGQIYSIDADIPASQQSLQLEALTNAKTVEWAINGVPHDSQLWQLDPGDWEIIARTEDGAEAKVKFSVE